MSLFRALVSSQRRWSAAFDRLLPDEYRVDGNTDFKTHFVRPYIRAGLVVNDVGGGKHPFFSPEEKRALRLKVVGLDISARELHAAPAGSYDDVVCADITQHRGRSDADLAICCTLLEHVQDVDKALASIASLLRQEGVALIFVPSRRALFARLNVLLPERVKKQLLFSIFPETSQEQGFRSFYDRCTPEEIRAICAQHGLQVIEAKYYFMSAYFTFFAPFHIAWRVWIMCMRRLRGDNGAETFAYALKRT